MEKKLQKIYLRYYNLLIVQDLWQAHFQILSIIFLKKFIELNVNLDMKIKKCETSRIKYKYYDYFLEYTNFKDDTIESKCLIYNKNCQTKLDENLKERPFNAFKFHDHNKNKFI